MGARVAVVLESVACVLRLVSIGKYSSGRASASGAKVPVGPVMVYCCPSTMRLEGEMERPAAGTNNAPAPVTGNEKVLLAVLLPRSDTWTIRLSVSAVEGVPVRSPEDETAGNPPVPGTLEDFDHV
jgi:hypothetical protein